MTRSGRTPRGGVLPSTCHWSGPLRTRSLPLVLAYVALAAAVTWPAVTELGAAVPGSSRTDLWNSLWSMWFVARSIAAGELPYATTLLNYPQGGTLLVADPLGALMAAPLIPAVGLAAAYALVVLAQLSLAGVVAHRFAEDLLRWLRPGASLSAAWVAGVGYATAPVLLSAVHNGTSEAFAGGWPALAAWACWRVAAHGGARRAALAAGALLLAALSSWYGAVVAFLFAGAITVFGVPGGAGRLKVRALALAASLALVAPLAWATHHAATDNGNLVGIKGDREVALVRRSTGPADPVGYVMPGDYRSPDFRAMSRYSEDFFHCHYLGWVLLAGAGLTLGGGRRRGTGPLWLAAGAGAVLSLGPVLARQGMAVIILGDRAIPLPYFLLERVPGFSALSLVYRLALAPALGVALLAALGVAGRGRLALVATLAILVEGRFASPLGGLPDTSDVRPETSIAALAAAPDGAVVNFPVVGGRDYLFEQTTHGKPIAGGLNFPNNTTSRRFWQAALDAAGKPDAEVRRAVASKARSLGVRYLVIHPDPAARPDMHDTAVRALRRAFPLLEDAGDDEVAVVSLW